MSDKQACLACGFEFGKTEGWEGAYGCPKCQTLNPNLDVEPPVIPPVVYSVPKGKGEVYGSDRLAEVKHRHDNGFIAGRHDHHEDVSWLIAEVVRLRAERDAVVEELNRYWRNQGIVR